MWGPAWASGGSSSSWTACALESLDLPELWQVHLTLNLYPNTIADVRGLSLMIGHIVDLNISRKKRKLKSIMSCECVVLRSSPGTVA